MTQAKVYVIMGSYSEYSDRSQWVTAVHLDKDNASQHLVRLRAALKVWESLDGDEREALAGGNPCGIYSHALDTVCGFHVQLESQAYWMTDVPVMVDVPDAPLTLQIGDDHAHR